MSLFTVVVVVFVCLCSVVYGAEEATEDGSLDGPLQKIRPTHRTGDNGIFPEMG